MSEVDISDLSDEGLGRPEKVEWCGDNALVLAWGGKVIVVGPGGDSLTYVRIRRERVDTDSQLRLLAHSLSDRRSRRHEDHLVHQL